MLDNGTKLRVLELVTYLNRSTGFRFSLNDIAYHWCSYSPSYDAERLRSDPDVVLLPREILDHPIFLSAAMSGACKEMLPLSPEDTLLAMWDVGYITKSEREEILTLYTLSLMEG